jgi:hypothetical protein
VTSSGWRCRTAGCQLQREGLKAEVAELTKSLAEERRTRAEHVKGLVRAASLDAGALQQQLETAELERADATYRAKSFAKAARGLASASVKQTQLIAELKAQSAALQAELAERSSEHLGLLDELARSARHAAESFEHERKELQREGRRLVKAAAKADGRAADAAAKTEAVAAKAAAAAAAAATKATAAATAAAERVRASKEDAVAARAEAVRARSEAMDEAAAEAVTASEEHGWAMHLLERRRARAEVRADSLREEVPRVPLDRTPEEWAALGNKAEASALRRERLALRAFLDSHTWRATDLAAVLDDAGMLGDIFDSKEGTRIYMGRVGQLLDEMERRDFGESFALFLHFEMQLTLDKIHRIMQAACKTFSPTTNRYKAKVLFYDKYRKDKYLKVPRLSPPRHKIDVILQRIYKELNTEVAEDGRIAYRSLTIVMQELLMQDPGGHDMPLLDAFLSGDLTLPIVISWDATGFGQQQFNTIALNNPYYPKSAQLLRLLGLGNCDDGRGGTVRLLNSNLLLLNNMILAEQGGRRILIDLAGRTVEIKPEVFIVTDVSALRHCEHLANSGWCMCGRDFALRTIPQKPTTCEECELLLKTCKSPTRLERYVLSHSTVPGEAVPRPCTASGCKFAHDPATALAEQAALLKEEAGLEIVKTKSGKSRFSRWRMLHASTHGNVQPGMYGAPMLEHNMDSQLLDPLHLAELGIPKTPWKHGILNNASDDARDLISEQFKRWKHPIDCRRKDDNRSQAQKWFTGEGWASLAAGKGGSPGGPVVIATTMLIIAEDLQQRGVTSGTGTGSAEEEVAAATVGGRGRGGRGRGGAAGGRGRGGFVRQQSPALDSPAGVPATDGADELTHNPTAIELAADSADLEIIRELYGSRAQTIINTLLGFDAYFNWYYPLKASIPFLCDMELRKTRMLSNCRLAIDLLEITERLSIRNHKSFLFHGAVYKVTRDIGRVADIWATDLSAQELQNAETKRVATSGGSKHLTTSSSGLAVTRQMTVHQGPSKLIVTKGYGTSMAHSTLRKLLGKTYLRRGDGLYSIPESRRRERLFGSSGSGRTKLGRAGSMRLECLGADYNPREDSCIKAFVRLLAARAEAGAAGEC